MGKLFGTDGVRGIANQDLTSELAMKIGQSAAYVLGNGKPITIVIGRDTRISGQMLLAALSAGLMSYGAHVIDLGIVPTPAVSFLIKKYNADMGVMISASHNPAEYNGIKLFNNEGFKLPDDVENTIESYILNDNLPIRGKVGTYETSNSDIDDYVNFLLSTIKEINPELKLIVDCANGSASVTAPLLFKKLNMKVNFISTLYDGENINENCGSTHLETLIDMVKNSSADVGIAFDGDADRCLMVDSEGNVVDGDFIMAITGLYYKSCNKLTNNTLVGTVMSNLGFKKFCEENEINFVATTVGDRYVLENMMANNYIIGGEQSGHIIFRNLANTGDGELTALQILNIMSISNKPLSELASVMQKYPQVLINVNVSKEGKDNYSSDEEINKIISEIENDLGTDGRVLVRASGTENLVRVMIEGLNIDDITAKANAIADLIKQKYGV
jgi:phosphoglucosamine mutase